MAHFGVHGVREVDRRGVSGQGYDFAFRREHVDFGRAKVFLERAQEFVGIRGFAGPVGELLNPFEVIDLGKLLIVFITLSIGLVRRAQGAAGLAVFLVFPVRGDAEFGAAVHVPSANLDFDRLATGAHHRGVQRLVHVELRHGDVVLESAGNRVPPRMHGTKRRIAVLNGVDDDAHTDQIVDVREIMAAHDHLLVDGEVILRASGDVCLDVLLVEILVDLRQNLLQVHIALAGSASHQHHDLVVDLRVEHLEAQFLELRLDGVHTESVGQRCVHVKGFTRLLLGGRGLHIAPGASVVYAVGELDHQGTHVAAHGHHEFANGFGLGGITHFKLTQLGNAIDQTGHGVAEFGAALIQRIVGVFHRVVQQAGCHHDRAHAQIRENLGNGQRVDDVRLARLAALGGVLDDGTPVGTVKNGQILIGVMGLAHLLDWIQRIERIGTDLTTQLTGGVLLAINLCHASHLPRHEVHCSREPEPCAFTCSPSLVPQPLLPSSP